MAVATEARVNVIASSNAAQISRAFEWLAKDQIPFATAVALTRVAQNAQLVLRKGIEQGSKEFFTIRSPRPAQGVRFVPAKKQDWPKPYAVVGDKDSFMVLQVTGGQKKSRIGNARVAVPFDILQRNRTAGGSIRGAKKPVPLRQRPDVFLDTQHANTEIKQRIASGGPAVPGAKATKVGGLANLHGLVTYWVLVDHANIKRRWPFDTIARDVCAKNYATHFRVELEAAVRSARVRAGSFSPEAGRAAYLSARARVLR